MGAISEYLREDKTSLIPGSAAAIDFPDIGTFTHLNAEEVTRYRAEWPKHPMKKILQYEIRKDIFQLTQQLTSVAPENLVDLQKEIKALNRLLQISEDQHLKGSES